MDIDHVGIAVWSLSEATPRWQQIFGAPASDPEEIPSQRVRVRFIEIASPHLELLEPTEADSPVARFLNRRGEGMHHIAFSVPNVTERLADLARRGERVVDREGRLGARGRIVGFAHPSAFDGVLVEFVERR